MSKAGQATAKERRTTYKDTHYCGPNFTFPAEDAEDISNAVSRLNTTNSATGPIKACLIRRASTIGASIPDTWKKGSANMGNPFATDPHLAALAHFELAQRGTEVIDGVPHVIRYGKVFQAGEYPEQNLTMTPEDCCLAALGFTPVANDLEHRPTILDGQLGKLRKVELAEDGESLMGEVAIPLWLEQTQQGKPISVSLAIHRGDKLIKKNALVLQGQVADAAVFSAYAEFAGQKGVQALHDAAVAHGAQCSPDGASTSDMAMAHTDVVQRFHDMAKAHGAACLPATMSSGPHKGSEGVADDDLVVITGRRVDTGEEVRFSVKSPARISGKNTAPVIRQKETAVVETVDLAQFNALKAQLDEQTKETERLRKRDADREKERIEERAAIRANQQVATFKAFPANRDAVKHLYVQAYTDDLAGIATFSTEVIESRVAALDAMFDKMPEFKLTEELVKDGELAKLAQHLQTRRANEEKTPTRERVDSLLKLDPLGATIVAERNGKNGN